MKRKSKDWFRRIFYPEALSRYIFRPGTLFFLVAFVFIPASLYAQNSRDDIQHRTSDEFGERLHFAAGAEMTLVGLSYGPRFEFLYDISSQRSGQMLRLAPGILYGPEFIYVPVALGYRNYFLNHGDIFQLFWGAGVEYQGRYITDGESAHQGMIYIEDGALLSLTPGFALSIHFGVDWAVLGPPGPGVITRVMLQW